MPHYDILVRIRVEEKTLEGAVKQALHQAFELEHDRSVLETTLVEVKETNDPLHTGPALFEQRDEAKMTWRDLPADALPRTDIDRLRQLACFRGVQDIVVATAAEVEVNLPVGTELGEVLDRIHVGQENAITRDLAQARGHQRRHGLSMDPTEG